MAVVVYCYYFELGAKVEFFQWEELPSTTAIEYWMALKSSFAARFMFLNELNLKLQGQTALIWETNTAVSHFSQLTSFECQGALCTSSGVKK